MGSDDYGSRIFKPKNRMVRYLIQFGFLLAVALAMASLSFSSQSLQATMNQRVLEILSATPMSSYTSFSLEQSPANHRSMYTAGVAGEPEIVWLLSFPNSVRRMLPLEALMSRNNTLTLLSGHHLYRAQHSTSDQCIYCYQLCHRTCDRSARTQRPAQWTLSLRAIHGNWRCSCYQDTLCWLL